MDALGSVNDPPFTRVGSQVQSLSRPPGFPRIFWIWDVVGVFRRSRVWRLAETADFQSDVRPRILNGLSQKISSNGLTQLRPDLGSLSNPRPPASIRGASTGPPQTRSACRCDDLLPRKMALGRAR